MKGRLENKIKTENKIQKKVANMPDYITKFYVSLKNKSHTTKMIYINNVIRFLINRFGRIPNIEELKEIDDYNIQVYISEIGYYENNGEIHELKESTQANIYSALSAFFSFMGRTYGYKNPFENNAIERPKIRENDIVYLEPEEVRKIEANILSGVGNKISKGKQEDWKYRDLLLFRIPVVNGLRVTALSEINIEDIDLANRKITVTEKGNITKQVGFDLKTSNYIQIWLTQRRQLMGDKANTERAFFISNRRTRMTVRSIERIIQKYTAGCVDKHITPHKLRSTFGTNVYDQTRDVQLVSKLLGHKTVNPTRRYVAVFEKDMASAINKVADLY